MDGRRHRVLASWISRVLMMRCRERPLLKLALERLQLHRSLLASVKSLYQDGSCRSAILAEWGRQRLPRQMSGKIALSSHTAWQ